MILSHQSLLRRHHELIGSHSDESLINPASIDIRIGYFIIDEDGTRHDIRITAYHMAPGEFVLAETLEFLLVPLDCAVELRLKSSRAREGYNHSLAFWFDPGWRGVGTLELSNLNRRKTLPLSSGLRIGQIIVHQLDEYCQKPYAGRYQGAQTVEASKE